MTITVADEYNMIIQLNNIDHIQDNLWLGAEPKDIREFKYVFALNGRPNYHIELGQMVVVRPFDDISVMPSESMLDWVSDLVLKASSQGPTLVHCQAGLNRSALVLALTLIKRGMVAYDAIALLREKRGNEVLFNKTFANWLLSYQPNNQ